ncbi:MAG: hypothetical protein AB7O98_02470 [Hyphomonadaceae bacterium]
MRKFGFLAAAAAAAILAGCGLGAPAYPEFGETSYRVEGMTADASGGAATQTVIYRDGPKMRVEANLPSYGQAAVVFDESTNAAYVLNPTTGAVVTTAPAGAPVAPSAAPTATTVPPPAATTPATPAPAASPGAVATPPAAAPAATVAPAVTGVAVRIEDASAPQPLEAAWAALGAENARHVGRCEVAGEDGNEWAPREAPTPGVERVACITDDGIVLRVTESGRTLWEATSLQRGEQDAALFGVPPGYQLIDPQAVAEQVGENMQQLDSVTGAPPAPQTAPAPRG